jgi:hypothetical protein
MHCHSEGLRNLLLYWRPRKGKESLPSKSDPHQVFLNFRFGGIGA